MRKHGPQPTGILKKKEKFFALLDKWTGSEVLGDREIAWILPSTEAVEGAIDADGDPMSAFSVRCGQSPETDSIQPPINQLMPKWVPLLQLFQPAAKQLPFVAFLTHGLLPPVIHWLFRQGVQRLSRMPAPGAESVRNLMAGHSSKPATHLLADMISREVGGRRKNFT
jgi:hypothetical protein